MKSAVSHAIKTNRFPQATAILAELYRNAKRGCTETDMWHATREEHCMMRGWSINDCGTFHFMMCHDLCVARATVRELETMVRRWYKAAQEQRIEDDAEFERRHPEIAAIPRAGKSVSEMTLDEFIFGA